MQSRVTENTEKGKIPFHFGIRGGISEEILPERGLERGPAMRIGEMVPPAEGIWGSREPRGGLTTLDFDLWLMAASGKNC